MGIPAIGKGMNRQPGQDILNIGSVTSPNYWRKPVPSMNQRLIRPILPGSRQRLFHYSTALPIYRKGEQAHEIHAADLR